MNKFINSSKVALLSIFTIVFALFGNIFPVIATANATTDDVPLQTVPTPTVTSTSVDKTGSENADGTLSWTIKGELPTTVDNNEVTIYDGSSTSGETINYSNWTLSFTGGNNGNNQGISVTNVPLNTVLANGWATIKESGNDFELILNPSAIATSYDLTKMTPMKFQINYTAKPTDPTNGKVYDNTVIINPNDGTIPVSKKATVTWKGTTSSSSSSSSSSSAVSSSSSSIPAVPPLHTVPTPTISSTGADKTGVQDTDGNVTWHIDGDIPSDADNNDVTISDTMSPAEKIDYSTWYLSISGGNNGGTGIQVNKIPLSTVLSLGWGKITKTSTGFTFTLNPNAIAADYGFDDGEMTPLKIQIQYQAKPTTTPTNGEKVNNTVTINPNNGKIPVQKKATITWKGSTSSSSSSAVISSSSSSVTSSSSSLPNVPSLHPTPAPDVSSTSASKSGSEGEKGNLIWHISGEIPTTVNNDDVTIYDDMTSTPGETIDYNNWYFSFTGGNDGGTGIKVSMIPLSTIIAHGWGEITKTANGFIFKLDPNAIAKAYGFDKMTPMKFQIQYRTFPTDPKNGDIYHNNVTVNPNSGSSTVNKNASIKWVSPTSSSSSESSSSIIASSSSVESSSSSKKSSSSSSIVASSSSEKKSSSSSVASSSSSNNSSNKIVIVGQSSHNDHHANNNSGQSVKPTTPKNTKLPQTGDDTNQTSIVIGLIAVGISVLFGVFDFIDRRKN